MYLKENMIPRCKKYIAKMLIFCNTFAIHATVIPSISGKDGQKGPRGGTLCFGDSDLRPIYDREVDALPPSLNELGPATESNGWII